MAETDSKYTQNGEAKKPRSSDKPRRVKDQHMEHNHMLDGLSPDMRSFYSELSQVFPEIRITSGKRTRGDHFSHHHEGNAIDIGKEHSDVFEYLTSTKEGLELMNKHELGILDETDPRNMEKTGASGPHYHIGKDSGLYKITKDRYQQLGNIQPLKSFYSQNPNFDYSTPQDLSGANLELHGSEDRESSVYLDGPGPDGQVSPFRLVMPTVRTGEAFKSEIRKEEKKAEIKEAKIKESEHRRAIESKEKEEQAIVQKVVNTMQTIRNRDQEATSGTSNTAPVNLEQPDPLDLDIQRGLPELPSIFKM